MSCRGENNKSCRESGWKGYTYIKDRFKPIFRPKIWLFRKLKFLVPMVDFPPSPSPVLLADLRLW